MRYREWIARGLAHALLADAGRPGGTAAHALRARAAAALGEDPAWLRPLVQSLARLSPVTWQHSELADLTRRIAEMPELDVAFETDKLPRVQQLILRPARMHPRPWVLDGIAWPELPTANALAAWLGMDLDRLNWLAGPAQAFRADPAPSREALPGLATSQAPGRPSTAGSTEGRAESRAAAHPGRPAATSSAARSCSRLRARSFGCEPCGGPCRAGTVDGLRSA